MKKIIIVFLISFLLVGCASKNEVAKFNVRSSSDQFEYENLNFSIKSISNRCVLDRKCTDKDNVSIIIYAGPSDYQIEYEVKPNKYTKLGDTGYYIKINFINSDTIISLYK